MSLAEVYIIFQLCGIVADADAHVRDTTWLAKVIAVQRQKNKDNMHQKFWLLSNIIFSQFDNAS